MGQSNLQEIEIVSYVLLCIGHFLRLLELCQSNDCAYMWHHNIRGALVLIFMGGGCVGSMLHIIMGGSSGVVVGGRVTNLEEDFKILVEEVLGVVEVILRGSQVNSSSPTSISFLPCK